MRLPLVLPLLCLAAAPAFAQEAEPAPDRRTFQPPAGCTAYVTIQSAACSVSHHFTCEGDPEGWQRRVDMDEQGITYFGAIDSETKWMESHHVLSAHSEFLEAAPADPASATELFADGEDAWDFITTSPEIGSTRYTGYDRLTGETVTIDGVTLDRTEYQLTATDAQGNELWRSTGNEYISRDWRMFLSGISSIAVGEEVEETDDTPEEFILPGERGFLSVSPKYGCGEVLSRLEAPLPGGQG